MESALQPYEIQELLKKGDSLYGHVITIQVMAVPDMSPPDQDAVRPALEGPQEMMRGDGG